MTGLAIRTVAAVVSAVAGILAGILGQWLTGRIYWGVLAGLLILIAVVAGAEIIKVRAENVGSPTGTGSHASADQSGELARQQTRISVGKNSTLAHSVIAGGDVDQSQTINMHRRHPALPLVVISAMAMLAAAGGTVYLVTQPGGGTRGSSPKVSAGGQPARNRISHQVSPASMLPRYNPPRLFDGKSIDLPGGPPVVADGVAYSYTDNSLTATRIADGHSLWTVSLPGSSELVSGPMSQESPPSPGIITTDSGQQLIVAAYFTTIPGSGIQADQDKTRVLAVDTSGTVRWDRTVPAPRTALPVLFAGQLHDSSGNAFVLDHGIAKVV